MSVWNAGQTARKTMTRSGRFGAVGAMGLAALLGTTGCLKGVGEPCARHSDCEAGLACGSEGTCGTCGDKVSCVAVDVVIRSCDAALTPTNGATDLMIRIEGDDLPTITKQVQLGERGVDLPEIPPGKNRRIFLEAVAGSTVVGRGASATFDVDFANPPPPQVVYLRAKNRFSPTNSATEVDAACEQMAFARAGHTATLLQDGRVLIAGGYTLENGTKKPIGNVEIYDPRTGKFTAESSAGGALKQARYGHVATLLPDGRVLLTGGIGLINDKENGLKVAELFDPKAPEKGWVHFLMRKSRWQHTATLLDDRYVLIAGGKENPTDQFPLASTEVFDVRTESAVAGTEAGPDLTVPRGSHAAMPIITDGNLQVLLVGGTDGNGPIQQSDVLRLAANNRFEVTPTSGEFQLSDGRANPLAVDLSGGANGVLVLGAPQSSSTNPEKLWDWFPLSPSGTVGRDVKVLPTARREACVARFDFGTMVGAIVVGGRSTQNASLLNHADVYTLARNDDTAAGAPEFEVRVDRALNNLATARARAACTTLADGSVLITGGETTDGGQTVQTASAEVFVP